MIKDHMKASEAERRTFKGTPSQLVILQHQWHQIYLQHRDVQLAF